MRQNAELRRFHSTRRSRWYWRSAIHPNPKPRQKTNQSMKTPTYLACSIAALITCAAVDAVAARPSIQLQPLSSVEGSTPGTSAAEIVAHDPATHRLFVVNGEAA